MSFQAKRCTMEQLLQKLAADVADLKASMDRLLNQGTAKEFYSPAEFGQLVHRATFTIQNWCRQGLIAAKKRKSGRKNPEWVIPHSELLRYQESGFLTEDQTPS